MNTFENVILSKSDFASLSHILLSAPAEIADFLEEELGRAIVVPDEELPTDVVAMNANVTFQDRETGKQMMMQLVYPPDAKVEENRISVLTPVGAALIGLRVGQNITWKMPSGVEKEITVIAVNR